MTCAVLQLLVSEDIYSTGDKQLAAQCYVQLNAAGLTPRLTPSYYKYSHQKYWIVDGKKYVPNRLECLMGQVIRLPSLHGLYCLLVALLLFEL